MGPCTAWLFRKRGGEDKCADALPELLHTLAWRSQTTVSTWPVWRSRRHGKEWNRGSSPQAVGGATSTAAIQHEVVTAARFITGRAMPARQSQLQPYWRHPLVDTRRSNASRMSRPRTDSSNFEFPRNASSEIPLAADVANELRSFRRPTTSTDAWHLQLYNIPTPLAAQCMGWSAGSLHPPMSRVVPQGEKRETASE